MKRRIRNLLLVLTAAVAAPSPLVAGGSSITVHVGPPSVGSGGSNPVSVPPINPVEYEVIYLNSNNFESNFAITPGLLFGMRSTASNGVYVSAGGGLVLSANGGGPGLYSSLGFNHGWFNAELKQAIGWDYSNNQMVSPYAIRIGLFYEL